MTATANTRWAWPPITLNSLRIKGDAASSAIAPPAAVMFNSATKPTNHP